MIKISFPPDETSICFEVYPYWITFCWTHPKWWWWGKEGPSQSYHWRFGCGFFCVGKHAL